MKRVTGSLALRLALGSALWVAVGLGAAAWFVGDVARQQMEAALDARLGGLLDAAAAAATLAPDGRVAVARAPAGADFERPFSGAYWQVTAPDGAVATSRSLWDETLPQLPAADGIRLRDVTGPRGVPLRLAEREVQLPEATAPAQVAVALSRAETEAEVARFRRLLAIAFLVLGLGLVGGVAASVVVGLAPLRRVRQALVALREGRRETLAVLAPAEVAPLVAEVDALIAANRATVERARAHVGNLAHALKTPLAVLRNALGATPPDLPAARAEAAALERLVQHHLARARVAARLAAAPASRPLAVAEEVAAALRRLFATRGIAIIVSGDAAAMLRMDAQDLTELLGNLMENACKWARHAVVVEVARQGADLVLRVADDGPGLPDEAARGAALQRGTRLDEAQPGTGLGLSIAADLALLHGGRLELGRAASGGLLATLHLPARGMEG